MLNVHFAKLILRSIRERRKIDEIDACLYVRDSLCCPKIENPFLKCFPRTVRDALHLYAFARSRLRGLAIGDEQSKKKKIGKNRERKKKAVEE